MRLFTRYILTEVGQVFLVTLAVLTLFMVLIGAGREAYEQGLGLVHIVRLVPFLLPNALLFAVPGTILFAVSTVYGRMSGSNEIVAIKSLGISPMVILWPTIILSIVLSLVTVWLNDLAVSWGYQGVQRLVLDSVEDIAYGVLRVKRSYSTKQFAITVTKVDGRKLIAPTISFQPTDNSPAITIRCQEAELRSNPGSGVLTIICRNGTVDAGKASFKFDDSIERDISLEKALQKGSASDSPAHLALRVIPEKIATQRLTIDFHEQQMAAQAAYQMLTGQFPQLFQPSWGNEERILNDQRNQLYRLQTEPPRRWANGFSCICFALVGAPMAIRLRNADALKSFFACFLPILLIYYPLLVYGVDRSKSGAVHPYTVWLANAILIAWGLWLLRRVLRY